MSDKPNKGGAPRGNCNALRHGLYSKNLPAQFEHLDGPLAAFTRRLERDVAAVHGEIGMERSAHIDRAVAWTRHGAICHELLCSGKDLDVDDIINLSREIARSFDLREKPLKELQLGKAIDNALLIPVFDSPPALAPSQSAAVPIVPAVSVDPSPAVATSPQTFDSVEVPQ